jgi:hypothetical protein
MGLVRLAAQPWPRELGWLVPGDNCTALGFQICSRALRDHGILEVPNGSNRGIRIDRMTLRSGLKPPVWWCAIEVGTVFIDCGVPVPEGYPLTDNWLPYVREGRWQATPQPGDAIVYGTRKKGPVVSWGNASHIGVVMRVPESGQKYTLTTEGNRGFPGTDSNDGLGVGFGPITRKDVLGYVSPDHLVGLLG